MAFWNHVMLFLTHSNQFENTCSFVCVCVFVFYRTESCIRARDELLMNALHHGGDWCSHLTRAGSTMCRADIDKQNNGSTGNDSVWWWLTDLLENRISIYHSTWLVFLWNLYIYTYIYRQRKFTRFCLYVNLANLNLIFWDSHLNAPKIRETFKLKLTFWANDANDSSKRVSSKRPWEKTPAWCMMHISSTWKQIYCDDVEMENVCVERGF